MAGEELARPYMGVVYRSINRSSPTRTTCRSTTARSSARRGATRRPVRPVVAGQPGRPGRHPEGDIIIKVNGQAIDGDHPLDATLSQYAPGDTVTLTILRDGQTTTVQLTLGTRPAPAGAPRRRPGRRAASPTVVAARSRPRRGRAVRRA